MSNWNCSQCSFSNHPDLLLCEICENIRGTTSSSNVTTETLVSIMQLEPLVFQMDDCSCTNGILEKLDGILTKSKSTYSLSWPYCLHFSQRNSFGASWSCGYRNIQIICSSLMQMPAYRSKLFSCKGRMPNIRILQQWIEEAWKDGFDTEGCSHFDGKLVGTKEWIGTTECCALLRFFGIRAHIVDFHQKDYNHSKKRKVETVPSDEEKESDSNQTTDVSVHIGTWLRRYFKDSSALPSSLTSSSLLPASDTASLMIDGKMFLPPLYFQHSGHSRTIVGIMNSDDNSNHRVDTLILDPACNGQIIKKNLEECSATLAKKWQRQIRKPLESMKKAEYQILYIADGFMSKEEREMSKIIASVSFSNQFY